MKSPTVKPDKPFYLPQLDSLRFLAFLFVFIAHGVNIVNNTWIDKKLLNVLLRLGWIGVDLFFVLSGFLITSLILKERHIYNNFSLRKFYMRRILRIWPLYFLYLLIGFFVIPYILTTFYHVHFPSPTNFFVTAYQITFFIFFLGNVSLIINNDVLLNDYWFVTHLWTISLEEQFYIVWPLLLKLVKRTKIVVFSGLLIILICFVIRFFLSSDDQLQNKFIYFSTLTRFDSLVFGSLLGVLYLNRTTLFHSLKKISQYYIQIPLHLLFWSYMYILFNSDQHHRILISASYSIIDIYFVYILYCSFFLSSLMRHVLEFKPLVWLGKISYGLYVWHIVSFSIIEGILFNVLHYNNFFVYMILAFFLNVFISWLSYRFYESQFLKLKKRFTRVESRPI